MRKVLAIVLSLMIVFSLTACSGKNEVGEPTKDNNNVSAPSSPKKYTIGGGSIGGVFYIVAGGISTLINKHLPEYFMCTVENTGGGSANLRLIQSGDLELGIAMTSSLYEAYEGKAEWTGGAKHEKIRTVLALYPSWLTVYTKANSGIKTMKDLNGKIVGLGTKGMPMDSVFRDFFKANNIIPKQIHNDSHAATAKALRDGAIDTAILFSYPPFPAISELETSIDLRFIPLTEEEQTYLVEKYNFYKKDELPAGSYKGAPEPVSGVSEWNVLASSSDVPADDIYLIVKTLCKNQEEMLAVHPSTKHMTAENTLNSNIYLHAGTVRYLKEIGIDVPPELIPPEYKD